VLRTGIEQGITNGEVKVKNRFPGGVSIFAKATKDKSVFVPWDYAGQVGGQAGQAPHQIADRITGFFLLL